jgi:ribonuclease HIII
MRYAGVASITFRCVVVMPQQFNLLAQSGGSKAAVYEWAASRLLCFLSRLLPQSTDKVLLYADKQGGRHHYAAFLQQVFNDRFVMTVAEGPEAARYRIAKGRSVWEAVFQPRAESASFVVALASMLSKYLREVLMDEFNEFWQALIPHLRPTAGYPLDARRFLADIESARQRLKIPQQILWRER